jgi:RimJ/RimL family protein N-acetyltransferase
VSTHRWLIETQRLGLRELVDDDASFLNELLNDPAFLANIGDRGVRSDEDARQYLRNGPFDSYRRHGFGLWMVQLRDSGESAGICGLLKREALDDVDVGFAFLPRYRARGYARESAAAVLRHAREVLALRRIVAIASPQNTASARVLESVGLRFERMVRLAPDAGELCLFATVERATPEPGAS